MTKRKKKAYVPAAPAGLIVWTDASFDLALSSHWQEGQQPPVPKGREHLCVTVGWITHIDDEFVQVTQTLTDGAHAHVANIPRGMVQSITVLEPVGDWEGA